jgi:hypothetical protein
MRLADLHGDAGFCFPLFRERGIDGLIEFPRGVIGNVQQLDGTRRERGESCRNSQKE